MRPARVPFARTTIPMEESAPPWTTRPTEPVPAPAPVMERVTEPPSLTPSGLVLPFHRVGPVPRAKRSESAPEPPAGRHAETIADSSQRTRERDDLRAFCLFVLAVLVIGNVGFWFALALLPTPKPAPVVAPSLPAMLLGALPSSSGPIPDAPSAAPAPSVAPDAASVAPVLPRAPRRPIASPPRRSTHGEIVNPWGD